MYSDFQKWTFLVLGWLVFMLTAVSAQSSSNFAIDTNRPILRQIEGLENNSYFGYSLVLHQQNANPANMAEALSSVRIIVSAPNGTAPGASVPNTGLVYSCPVNPGQCSPLPGKLFDTTPNGANESKEGQFLGSSMASNGDRFLVCAHRHTTTVDSESPSLFGKCFFTRGRTLVAFEEYQPCDSDIYSENLDSVCQAGTSSIIVPDGSSYAIGLGAPGMNTWRGAVIRRSSGGSTSTQGTSSINEFSYQGYAITSGRFMSNSRIDFAVSLPRNNRYFGSVNLVMNDNSLQLVSQPLSGMQMGEYYGFSLLAADLNGDGYDELLVGAPLYRANGSEPEAGRVFLYRNTEGSLEFVRTIEGKTQFSRFGYAMANLGDVNGDGFDDIAISAPFSRTTDSGTVFIYYSHPSLLLSISPNQIIQGTDLNLSQDLDGLRGFGTSLASGVDVDLNGYNDLLIGSFISQKVFLLRTRPLASVQATITANPQIVDLTKTECVFRGSQYACFRLTACATYTGRSVANDLTLRFIISGDTQSIEKRVFFENGNSNIQIDLNAQACPEITAYIQNNTRDTFNPFIIEMTIDPPPIVVNISSGNDTVNDLSTEPVLSLTTTPMAQVETLKECSGGVCIPDLRISFVDTVINTNNGQQVSTSTITVGLTLSIDIVLDIMNNGEDAFQALMSFSIPTTLLEMENAFNQTSNGEVSLRCTTEQLSLANQNGAAVSMTRHNCSIGNPFSGPGNIRLRVRLNPRNTIMGNEGSININFTVSSLIPENRTSVVDNSNFALIGLSFKARANISIDNGVVTPQQSSYSDNSVLIINGNEVTPRNSSQLGSAVDVSFLIRNAGPSRIPEVQLDITWPLNGTLTGNHYYLYITSIESSGGATVTCSTNYINPLQLEDSSTGNSESQGSVDTTVSMGNGRRKKRSTVKRTLRNKRQAITTSAQEMSVNRTVNCASSNPIFNCVNIRCTAFGLSGSSSVQVDINARIDERFFASKIDRYNFIPTASISIINGDFIESNEDSSDRSATANIRIIPASSVLVNDNRPTGSTSIEWWVIVVPIVAGLIIIILVGSVLWMCGFFRRKRHEEIKQKREELRNLNNMNEVSSSNTDLLNQ